MAQDERTVIYSELFGKLINDGELDGTMASFLYYMFPKELFIRALSLLDSCDMFIYVYDISGNGAAPTKSSDEEVSTDADSTVTASFSTTEFPIKEQHTSISTEDSILLDKYLPLLYEGDDDIQYRLIVKSTKNETPVYVDVDNWLCSCTEFNEILATSLNNGKDLKKEFICIMEDLNDFSDDRFGQIDAHSLSMQKYVVHKKLLCSHLLAYSIVLRSSKNVLRYYVKDTKNVILIPVSSIDEWLKLHINVLA